jgi:DNA-binding LacI/PurR family transcriptional regulator
MAATITDVAKAAGVSVASVSRVFNRRPNVRPEVASRVLERARELGYRPRQSARRDCVAMVVGSLALGTYGSLVAAAVAEAAQARGWRLELLTPDDLQRLQGGLVNGVLSAVPGALEDLRELQHLREFGELPVVTLNHQVHDLPCVRSADRQALFDAVALLAARQHRRIALITVDTDSFANVQRRSGYADGLRRAGLPIDAALVARCRYPSGAVETCARLLRGQPDAIIATGEESGPQIAHALDLLGCRVGRDLSFITHEFPNVSPWQLPPHSSIAQDFQVLAERALDRIAGVSAADDSVVPCRFHERETVRIKA